MDGEIAVAYNTDAAGDPTGPARILHGFAQKLQGKLAIAGGLFQGVLKDAAGMQEIATIPPLATLRAMFAQIVNSPRQRFAVVLSKVAEKKV